MYNSLLNTSAPGGRSLSDEEGEEEVLIRLSVLSMVSELN
jgi:hypothetical protein